MRRRVTAVFAAGMATFLLLDLAVVLVLWPQLRRAEALSSQYAANARLLAEILGDIQIIRSSATQHHVRVRDATASRLADGLPAEIADARRSLDAAADAYAAIPLAPAEAHRWTLLSREVLPELERTIEEVVAPPARGASVDQALLDRLRGVTNRAVSLLRQLSELNAAGLDATAKRMHDAVSRLVSVCIALGAFGIAGGVLFIRWTLRALNEFERSTGERIEELEQFAGRVAHDLRNPLQAMSMSLALIQRRATDERTRSTAEKAQAAARRMAAFIQELLQFARSGANPEPDASAPVSEVLHAVVQDLAPGADEKHVTISVAAADDLHAAISPEALRAVVANLADNAVKHMPPDAPERLVELRAERSGGEVRIRVRDTGAGIPPEAVPRLFDPFFRATTRPGGFGIGLKTVKRLVDAHGGRISLETTRGSGSVFTVSLPTREPPAPGAGREDVVGSPAR